MSDNQSFEPIIQDGLQLPEDKKLYFNGFLVSITPQDVIFILQHDNRPVAYLNASHTVAKTLFVKLQGVIESFESSTKMVIPTLDELEEKMKAKADAKTK